MNLSRNVEHEWEYSEDQYDLRCDSCNKPWNYKWGDPPAKYCNQLKQTRLNKYSSGKDSKKYDSEGNKVVYGPEFKRVSRLNCCVCGAPGGPAHHIKHVNAGGKDMDNLVPFCHKHHREIHDIGRKSFQEKYNINIKEIAKNV